MKPIPNSVFGRLPLIANLFQPSNIMPPRARNRRTCSIYERVSASIVIPGDVALKPAAQRLAVADGLVPAESIVVPPIRARQLAISSTRPGASRWLSAALRGAHTS